MINFPHESVRRTDVTSQAAMPTAVLPRSRPAAPVSRPSVAQATLVLSLRPSVLDTLAARQTPYGRTAAPLAMQHQPATVRRMAPTTEPVWIIRDAPVGRGEAFMALCNPKRKELQGALDNVHSQLQSAASPALANDFRTALFTPDATLEEKGYALRSSSAAQYSFLQPIAAFLHACQDWLTDEDDLPDEAQRMLGRLQAFLQSCRRPVLAAEAHSLTRRLDAIRAYVGTRGGASLQIPEDVQAALAVLAGQTTERVRENCELLKSVHARMADIERRQDTKRTLHSGWR